MTISVHDNNVYAFFVDCENQRVTLYSQYNDGSRVEFTDIVFTDVLAHRVETVLGGNILFDVEELDPKALVDEEPVLFRESWRHGWPPVEYHGDLQKLKTELERLLIRAYRISSSYGMCGWVLANQCDRIKAEGAYVHSRN